MQDRTFLVWQLDRSKRAPSMQSQVDYARAIFIHRFDVEPDFILTGPFFIYEGAQLLVPEGYIYMALPLVVNVSAKRNSKVKVKK